MSKGLVDLQLVYIYAKNNSPMSVKVTHLSNMIDVAQKLNALSKSGLSQIRCGISIPKYIALKRKVAVKILHRDIAGSRHHGFCGSQVGGQRICHRKTPIGFT
jgi:hypothetical protein